MITDEKEHYTATGPEARAGSAFTRPDRPCRVIVAIPCFNEETAVGSIALLSKKYADLVLVLDDGSRDRTAEIATLAGARVISSEANMGKGAAIKNAFAFAIADDADVLVLIDGDGQHNPDEIPALIQPILDDQADMVNGSRFLQGTNQVPGYRRVGQEVLTAATNVGSNKRFTDSQNGFRAFSRKTFKCFTFGESRMAIESEMLMDSVRANLRIVEVPIDVRYDVEGSTYNPVSHGFSVLNAIIGLISQRRPLLFFGIPGFVLLLLASYCFFYTLDSFNRGHTVAVGFTMLGILTTMLGFFSIFTGIMLWSIQNSISRLKQSP